MPDDSNTTPTPFARVPADIIYMHEEDGYLRVMTGSGLYVLDSSGTEALADPNGGTPRIWLSGNFEDGLAGDKTAPVPYDIIVPKAADCTNIFATFAISATHVAFGSIRMEFTSMQMGQSAGLAAALSIDEDVTVQNVDYDDLRTALLASAALSGEVAPVLPQTN